MSCIDHGVDCVDAAGAAVYWWRYRPLHLAAALRVPVVAIYGPTDPARNGPYGTRSIVLRSPESVTTHARRAKADEGLLAIGSDAVVCGGTEVAGWRPQR